MLSLQKKKKTGNMKKSEIAINEIEKKFNLSEEFRIVLEYGFRSLLDEDYPAYELDEKYMLKSILDNKDCQALKAIRGCSTTSTMLTLQDYLANKLQSQQINTINDKKDKKLSDEVSDILSKCQSALGQISTLDYLLLCLSISNGETNVILNTCGISADSVINGMSTNKNIAGYAAKKDLKNLIQKETERSVKHDNGSFAEKVFDKYEDDGTKPLISEQTLNSAIPVLNSKENNNLLIIGEHGIGKTYNSVNIPLYLKEKRTVLSLNVKKLLKVLTSMQDMGINETLNKIIKSLKNGNCIVIFDDIDKFDNMGIGGGNFQTDTTFLKTWITNILDEEGIPTISTINVEEYTKKRDKDMTFFNKFIPLTLYEPSKAVCEEILKRKLPTLNPDNNIIVKDEIIRSLIGTKISGTTKNPLLSIKMLDLALSVAKNNDEKELSPKSIEMAGNILKDDPNTTFVDLKKFEEQMNSEVIGQENAISEISKSIIRRNVLKLKHNRPASFLFIGESGVGKTFVAKNIAKYAFGGENRMIRLDMGEFSESHSISKLIGTPPGYIGFEEGGKLTNEVRKNGQCVILLDEIEKAHDVIFNSLLQMIDEGRMTDGKGVTVDFSGCIVIMTSNIGIRRASEFKHNIGFVEKENNEGDIINTELKKKFAPEFLNRLDNIVMFNKLTDDNLKSISKNNLKKLADNLRNEMGISTNITDNVIDFIANEAINDEKTGARKINLIIASKIENSIAEYLLDNPCANNITIDYDQDNKKIAIS